MEKIFVIPSESEMLALGKSLAAELVPGDLVFLQGNLGAGKTTLARGILHGLGCSHHVKSPTYTIVESYPLNGIIVYHFDLYRIHDPQELCDIGLTDYLRSDAIILVEWPEKGSVLFPQPSLTCCIETPTTFESGRRIIVTSKS